MRSSPLHWQAWLWGDARSLLGRAGYHGKEYFSVAKYGPASPRVVEDGQPVPRGGGQYLVGHPYTIAGHTYYPGENSSYTAVGMASWYGDAFHGRRTANGEVYDMRSLTAAHPTMPLPSYARVTNLANGYSVIVRVNDRGPYHGGRVMDVSSRVADVLDFKRTGTAKIKVEYVGRAPLEGSDDNELLASLRTDGSRAILNGMAPATETEVAAAEPATPSFFHFGSAAPPSRAGAGPCRARGSAGVAARPGAGQRRRGRGSPSAPHRASSGAPRASVRSRQDPLCGAFRDGGGEAAASAGATFLERSRALFRARVPSARTIRSRDC